MKQIIFYLILLMSCGILSSVAAKEQTIEHKAEKKHLYIGVEAQRIPYSYVNDEQKIQGILVDAAIRLCDRIDAQCTFVADNFAMLLQQLATQQLHAIINIDSVILPKIDKLKLSSPLCRITPVFIQQKSASKKNRSDFKNTTIGVLEGSLLHFYLLDNYSDIARLKVYPVLESGVFDLVSGRIDALYTDNAFFQQRIATTSLIREITSPTLIAEHIEQPVLTPINMALILREKDTELFAVFETALLDQKHLVDCARLLKQTPFSNSKQSEFNLKQPKIETEN